MDGNVRLSAAEAEIKCCKCQRRCISGEETCGADLHSPDTPTVTKGQDDPQKTDIRCQIFPSQVVIFTTFGNKKWALLD